MRERIAVVERLLERYRELKSAQFKSKRSARLFCAFAVGLREKEKGVLVLFVPFGCFVALLFCFPRVLYRNPRRRERCAPSLAEALAGCTG